ncbi:MAG: hypothetical protein A2293_02425 [Elusimicrobia bacterium RIFOXYB2_FULL_49_7]|nr:MAG: hypothetical protein A2293_02425 [Elusimicrobia bacterium RIFOXYB2_FULL_49_7]
MKTYKKGDLFFLEFPEDILEEYDEELDQILSKVASLGKYSMVANLKNARYLSTHTIRLLIKCHKSMESIGKSFYLIHPTDDILKLLEFTNLNKILCIYSDEHALFQALSGQTGTAALSSPPPSASPLQETFTYTLQDMDKFVLVRMSGYIRYFQEMKRFEEDIVNYVKRKHYNYVFNMEKITFIDSLGIARFVKLQNFLKSKNGRVVFCSPNELVTDFFNILGLANRFLLFSTEDEAFRHMA